MHKHQVSALLPAVSLLEGRSPDGSHALELHLEAAPLEAALSGQQLDYLRTFAASLAATFESPPTGETWSRNTIKKQLDKVSPPAFMHQLKSADMS